jgi:hypothetical protein
MPKACAGCSNKCKIKVCTKWIPASDDKCTNPGSGGGCCVREEIVCDPNCEEPVPDSPPTLSSDVTCSAWGANGWCIGSATLDFTATESKGRTLLLYGNILGSDFSCNNGSPIPNPASCSVPLPEGNAVASYAATSSLNMTTGGNQAWKRDITAPTLNGSFDQSANGLNWFSSAVNLSVTASDVLSGIASIEYSYDNVTWQPYSAPLHFTDGSTPIYLITHDGAGNATTFSETVQVDSQAPQLSRTLSGTNGTPPWYISDVQIELFPSDAAPSSGTQYFAYTLDGTNWISYTAPIPLFEGVYAFASLLVDNADHQAALAEEIKIDTSAPEINVTHAGTQGSANFYTSAVTYEMTAKDSISGVTKSEYSLDGSTWQPYTVPLTIADGFHELQFRAENAAGLETLTEIYTFQIDTHAPGIKLPSRWYLWETGELFVKDETSKIKTVTFIVRDGQNRWKKFEQSWDVNRHEFSRSLSWKRVFGDGVTAPVGIYPVTVIVEDSAGNTSQRTAEIVIPAPNAAPLPTFTPTPVAAPVEAPPEAQAEAPAAIVIETTSTPVDEIVVSPLLLTDPGETTPSAPQPLNANDLLAITAAAATGAFVATQRKKSTFTTTSAQKAANATASDVAWGSSAVATITAFKAENEERMKEEAEARRRAAEAAASRRQSNYMQRRAAEKEGRLAQYLREKNMTDKERKQRQQLQAIWDKNGRDIYDANQAFKEAYGKEMDTATREQAIKDATVNGHFSAGAYATNLNTARQAQAKKDNPYAGAADRIRAAANEIEDEKKIGYVDSERDEVRKIIALNEEKNAPVDSATASYMAMAAATKGGNPYKMASPMQQDDDPLEECKWWQFLCRWRKSREEKKRQSVPISTPAFNPTENAIRTQVAGTMLAPTAQPTPTPTPMPLSLRVATLAHQNFQLNNPNYYRFGFAGWDNRQTNCSNFVSQILWDAGVRFPGSTWNGDTFKSNPTGTHDNAPWYSTPTQQELFSSYNGEFRIALNENVALRDDPNYLRVLENYPQLFAPGNMVFTKNRVIMAHNGEVIGDGIVGQFSHVVLVDINSTLGNPLVVEQDGPADYIVKNGSYKTTWDADANDYFYERNLNPHREVRSLSDIPTIEIDDQSRTVTSYPSEISIIPVEPINLEAYGVDSDNLTPGSLRYENKDCYTIQPSLLYCPPTVSP